MGAMDFETLVRNEEGALTARLTSVLGGDRAAAEDLRQEAFARAWRSLPRELDPDRQRAWLRRTAGNLAIDELRRRARRPAVSFEAAGQAVGAHAASEPDAAHDALDRLSTAERFLLLLRFQGGFSHLEVARLLGISEEAARKRTARARTAFLRGYRAARTDSTPLVVLLVRGEPPAPYVRWLEDAGARVRQLPGAPTERELALADGLVFTGAVRDLHSELYGETPRSLRGEPDLEGDRVDLAGVRIALALDLAFAGICRGHQLLNLASRRDALPGRRARRPHRLEPRRRGASRRDQGSWGDAVAARALDAGHQQPPSGRAAHRSAAAARPRALPTA